VWAVTAPALLLPATLRPWTVSLDLSRWELASTLSPGWQVRRDPRFPATATAMFSETGRLTLDAPEAGSALLKLKIRFAAPEQRLRLRFNDSAIATIAPETAGGVERWRTIIPQGLLHAGANHLTLTNTQPSAPIEIEKVELGNVRRRYPALGGLLVVDPQERPSTVSHHLVLVAGGLVVAAVAAWLTIGLSDIAGLPSWGRWIGLAPPILVVVSIMGAAVGSAVTPYAWFMTPPAFLRWWVKAWGLGIGWILCLTLCRYRHLINRYTQRVVTPLEWTAYAVGWVTYSALSGIGRLTQALTSHRWGRRAALLALLALALTERIRYYLQHSADIFGDFNTGSDASVYLATALAIVKQHPYLISLHDNFPLLLGVGNSPLVLSTVISGFIKTWELYPGIAYWGWTLLFFSSLLCLFPYAWQRLWGFPGLGGVAVGVLLATSQLLQEQIPVIMTDLIGVVLLGGAFLLIGRLAILARWRDVIAAAAGLTILAYSRTANTYLSVFLILALGVGWFWTSSSRQQAAQRMRRFGGLIALTALGIIVVQWAIGGPHYPFLLGQLTLGHWYWATHHGFPRSPEPLRWFWNGLMVPGGALWHDHPLWILLLPSCLGFGIWAAWRRRSPHALPALLALIPWLGYLASTLLAGKYPRYALPWLLMQGLLMAQLGDVLWGAWRRRIASPLAWGSVLLILIWIGARPSLRVAGEWTGQWRQFVTARQHAIQYLTWVKPQLPDTAMVFVSTRADPWGIARRLDRPVLFSNHASVYGLVIDPHRLARHPLTVFEIASGPVPPNTQVVEHYLTQGNTLVVLDPVVDPEAFQFFERECGPRTLGFLPRDRFRFQRVGQDPHRRWAWHTVTFSAQTSATP